MLQPGHHTSPSAHSPAPPELVDADVAEVPPDPAVVEVPPDPSVVEAPPDPEALVPPEPPVVSPQLGSNNSTTPNTVLLPFIPSSLCPRAPPQSHQDELAVELRRCSVLPTSTPSAK